MTMYEVSCFNKGQQVGAYFQQYGELVEIIPEWGNGISTLV